MLKFVYMTIIVGLKDFLLEIFLFLRFSPDFSMHFGWQNSGKSVYFDTVLGGKFYKSFNGIKDKFMET